VQQERDNHSAYQDVTQYYDRNTPRFLRFSRGSGALHRKLWPPEVRNEAEALLYVNSIILDILKNALGDMILPPDGKDSRGKSRTRIIDLGCGVGGTVFWLADRIDAEFVGITISPVQAEIARNSAGLRDLHRRCSFQKADMLDFEPEGRFHGAVAVESFSHGRDAAGFFKQASHLLLKGGVLILIDDVRTESRERHTRDGTWTRRFARGWHLHSLMSVDHITQCALESGLHLIENRNLTPLIRVHPALLFFLRPLQLIPLPWYFWDNIRGGIALQFCTRKGFTQYRCMTFRKD
jgi:tocopherol O-methyltransferase